MTADEDVDEPVDACAVPVPPSPPFPPAPPVRVLLLELRFALRLLMEFIELLLLLGIELGKEFIAIGRTHARPVRRRAARSIGPVWALPPVACTAVACAGSSSLGHHILSQCRSPLPEPVSRWCDDHRWFPADNRTCNPAGGCRSRNAEALATSATRVAISYFIVFSFATSFVAETPENARARCLPGPLKIKVLGSCLVLYYIIHFRQAISTAFIRPTLVFITFAEYLVGLPRG